MKTRKYSISAKITGEYTSELLADNSREAIEKAKDIISRYSDNKWIHISFDLTDLGEIEFEDKNMSEGVLV